MIAKYRNSSRRKDTANVKASSKFWQYLRGLRGAASKTFRPPGLIPRAVLNCRGGREEPASMGELPPVPTPTHAVYIAITHLVEWKLRSRDVK